MSKIIITENIGKALPKGSFVYTLINNVTDIFKEADYFPEYTLHDEDHINNVLMLIEKLITPTTWNKLSHESIEVLVCAAILHDLGMFVKREGFEKLIFGEHKKAKTDSLDRHTWNELWKRFYRKAQRWDDSKLNNVFGKGGFVETGLENSVPFEDTKFQRLLYGEFLRQNHHRLAFDITQFGFPGNKNIDVFANCPCDGYTKAIIGVVARSHGMALRDVESYLSYFPIDIEKTMPIYYLMAVLRMADYLDIGRKRASKTRQDIQTLYSPISNREFELNQAIDAPIFDFPKKSVFLNANPTNSRVYVHAEETLASMQKELDMCWAVLSEKYQYEYELSIHRVSSNLYDDNRIKAFNNTFLTKKAGLKVNPEVMKLLIQPLYGNNPAIGVRELLQNSVDACNEREILEKEKRNSYEGKITLSIDTTQKTFTITDNGIGMDSEIIIDYYLTIGASFRNSDSWKDVYIDEDGQTKVARSGRFGIGMLAAFLLGNNVLVSTRHYADKKGFQFNLESDTGNLEVKRVPNIEIGTTITLELNSDALKYFDTPEPMPDYGVKWCAWYFFNKPKITYLKDGYSFNQYLDGMLNVDKNEDWNCYELKNKYSVYWKNETDFRVPIVYNGFWVREEDYYRKFNNQLTPETDVEMPKLSIIDPNHIFGINIIKNSLDKEVLKENLEFMKIMMKCYLFRILRNPIDYDRVGMAGEKSVVVANKRNFVPFHKMFLEHANTSKILVLNHASRASETFDDYLSSSGVLPVLVKYFASFNQLLFPKVWAKKDINPDSVEQLNTKFSDEMLNLLSLGKEIFYPHTQRKSKIFANSKGISYALHYSIENGLMNNQVTENDMAIAEFLSENISSIALYELFSSNIHKEVQNEQMLEILKKWIPYERNNGWIPIDRNERAKMYPEAFEEMKKYK